MDFQIVFKEFDTDCLGLVYLFIKYYSRLCKSTQLNTVEKSQEAHLSSTEEC